MSGYAKVYTSILDSSVWSESYATRLVWITMLAMANNGGRVEASVGGLARRAQVTREECEAALEVLLSPDPDDKSGVAEGRRIAGCDRGWTITNYEYYRTIRDVDRRREQNRIAQRRHRERNADNADSQQSQQSKPRSRSGRRRGPLSPCR